MAGIEIPIRIEASEELLALADRLEAAMRRRNRPQRGAEWTDDASLIDPKRRYWVSYDAEKPFLESGDEIRERAYSRRDYVWLFWPIPIEEPPPV